MEQQMLKGGQTPYSQLYSIQNQQFQRIIEGNVKLDHFIDDKGFVQVKLIIQSFQLQFPQTTPFVHIEFGSITELVFEIQRDNALTGLYVLIISKHESELQEFMNAVKDCLELTSQSKIDQNPQLNEKIQTHCPHIFSKPLLESGQGNKIGYYIEKGGYKVGEGFEWVGNKIAQGTNFVGEKIKDNINNGNRQMNQSQADRIQESKSKTKGFCKKTGHCLSQVLQPIANGINKGIKYVQNKTKNSDNKGLKYVHNLGVSSNAALTNVYRGITKGGKKIGNTVGDNTRKISEKKFGEDYTNAILGTPQEQEIELQQSLNKEQNLNQDIEEQQQQLQQQQQQQLVYQQPQFEQPKQQAKSDFQQTYQPQPLQLNDQEQQQIMNDQYLQQINSQLQQQNNQNNNNNQSNLFDNSQSEKIKLNQNNVNSTDDNDLI